MAREHKEPAMLPTTLIVLTFARENDADEVLTALDAVSKAGELRIHDYAIARKNADASVETRDRIDSGVRIGAAVGGAAGLLLGAIFVPIGGLILGAAGGAILGRWADLGIDEGFVDEVTASLQPGGSALFLTAGSVNMNALVAALEPFEGTLHHTNLPESATSAIERALR
jgi:uncharacterized membrane protein